MKKYFIFLGVVLIFISCAKNNKQIELKVEEPGGQQSLIQAEAALTRKDLKKAKQFYQEAVAVAKSVEDIEQIKKKIEDINMEIIFSSLVDDDSEEYVVVPNDALIKIASKFNTTVELIRRANNLKSDIIVPGQKLKVQKQAFSIVVDKSQNTLFLKEGSELIKTYLVATGENNSTPVGNFKVVNKLRNPTWFRTGAVIAPGSPDNILGSRWLGLDIKGYGIHGTVEPDKLGSQVTLGCIRMNNKEVEELFDLIPSGTEVTIVD